MAKPKLYMMWQSDNSPVNKTQVLNIQEEIKLSKEGKVEKDWNLTREYETHNLFKKDAKIFNRAIILLSLLTIFKQ